MYSSLFTSSSSLEVRYYPFLYNFIKKSIQFPCDYHTNIVIQTTKENSLSFLLQIRKLLFSQAVAWSFGVTRSPAAELSQYHNDGSLISAGIISLSIMVFLQYHDFSLKNPNCSLALWANNFHIYLLSPK